MKPDTASNTLEFKIIRCSATKLFYISRPWAKVGKTPVLARPA